MNCHLAVPLYHYTTATSTNTVKCLAMSPTSPESIQTKTPPSTPSLVSLSNSTNGTRLLVETAIEISTTLSAYNSMKLRTLMRRMTHRAQPLIIFMSLEEERPSWKCAISIHRCLNNIRAYLKPSLEGTRKFVGQKKLRQRQRYLLHDIGCSQKWAALGLSGKDSWKKGPNSWDSYQALREDDRCVSLRISSIGPRNSVEWTS